MVSNETFYYIRKGPKKALPGDSLCNELFSVCDLATALSLREMMDFQIAAVRLASVCIVDK